VSADVGRIEDGLAGLGVEDEGSEEEALDEFDERVAFLLVQEQVKREQSEYVFLRNSIIAKGGEKVIVAVGS
jgi:hypothetical protein